ncbi:MAG: sugar kinase [Sphingobium sp.]|nr:MAG: sugar kinase [Sphingobium sp.]
MSRDQIRLSGTNLERAADHNQRVTLHAIRVKGPLTRIDLAHITGLTSPAIANITKRLLAEGLIDEAGQRRGGRGQPATKLVINKSACYAIGVNIDRDHITIVLVDFAGQILARISREMPFPMPEDVQTLYQRSIDNLIKEAGIDAALLVGIGVAKPDDLGLVDLPGRPADYARWETTDIAALFARPIQLPVFIENDAAAAAMGELQLGHGQKHASFFYILISSGLGGGLVIDGTYFRGADGRSGEIGFMMTGNGAGQRDQVQNLVSLSGLAVELAAAGLSIGDLFSHQASDPALTQILDKWIEHSVERLSDPLIAINCLINPGAILIGGRLPGQWVDQLALGLNRSLRQRGTNVPVMAPVSRAMLAEDAPAVGAAILPFSHFHLPKPSTLWSTDAPPDAVESVTA